MDKARLLRFKEFGDERGTLVALEALKEIPFEIKRVFYTYGMQPGAVRGLHANRNSRMFMAALAGSCRVMVDNGRENATFVLNSPAIGLLMEKMTWKEMSDFSSDCILICLSDQAYDPAEYINDYETFKREAL